MPDFKRNNLDKSLSPYLLQHVANPVWWQEWRPEVIRAAVDEGKPLFVSVGYATCHWCHVMAAEAFSDKNTADFLNSHFICIKVDREQRPDIDQFLMQFIQAQSGHGGWPLNVFLTADLRPIYALTYAPAHSGARQHSLLSIAEQVLRHYEKNSDDIPQFIAHEEQSSIVREESLVENLSAYHDADYGGFGHAQKFPPHSTLLYLLYFLCVEENNAAAQKICRQTLDAMRLRGLADHLQGGIFRYCVDRQWTIPHFEKMLYDQAMALWTYALAYKVMGNNEYKKMAEGIVRCLDECFADDGLYISAHDADTEHVEGATYVWSYAELKDVLTPHEFKRLSDSYYIDEQGNFEGRIHLIRKKEEPLSDIEEKLLFLRKERAQPQPDKKILCGINALTAIGLIQAGRNLEIPGLQEKAAQTVRRLVDLFWDGNALGHSYYNGVKQTQSFLFDAATLLVAISMLYEDDSSWHTLMTTMAAYVETFSDGEKWVESRAADFQPVYASLFDHPVPSSISLAEMGVTRVAMLAGKETLFKSYRAPHQADFFNITAMLNNGLFHMITSKSAISWSELPANTLQRSGEPETDCYKGTCRILKRM
ncbi:MAG: thioredoxin domain-containing protein [Smithellaceae bacterium]